MNSIVKKMNRFLPLNKKKKQKKKKKKNRIKVKEK